ncbi:MAG: peptidoglycan-binding domain-containing protein [bacterium]
MLTQSVLQQSGYYHGPVDGNLSQSARQALMGFQKDDDLEVTGELDDELLCRLMALRQRGRIPPTNFYRHRLVAHGQKIIPAALGAIHQAIPKAAPAQ